MQELIMVRSSRRFSAFMAGLFALLLSVGAFAAEAETFVKSKQNELTVLLKQPKSNAAEQKIGQVFDQMLDYHGLAKDSLGDFWSELTPPQQQEFESLLKDLVRRAYRKNLRKTLDYEVAFQGEVKADRGQLVRTVARNKSNKREEPISVDYVLHQVNGEWRVYDIVTEGSSLLKNYQDQFRRIIKKKGFDELLRRMRRKVETDS
jgi:phospholipid transport system substrate-binding protein